MTHIKAIQTEYKGHAFRSRLEARWAVYFDTLGIEWRYENQGYERDGSVYVMAGEDPVTVYPEPTPLRYLPDFYLPQSGMFVEVKGDLMAYAADWQKHSELHDFGGVLPGFSGSFGENKGLVILSDIPRHVECGVYAVPVLQHHKGLIKSYAILNPYKPAPFEVIGESMLSGLMSLSPVYHLEVRGDDWLMESKVLGGTNRYHPLVVKALLAARSARFEHGHSGAVLGC